MADAATGETDLATLLRHMEPHLHDGAYVYTQAHTGSSAEPDAVVAVREAEGLTLVLPQDKADAHGLAYDYVASWITLQVHSSLDAVGLTAAVSTALADAGISANVVAGFSHDHVFVPRERGDQAIDVLKSLTFGPRTASGLHHVEIWVADLAEAASEWAWLLQRVGFSLESEWSEGQTWAASAEYLTLTTSPNLSGSSHDRRSPGVNHLAFKAGSTDSVDGIMAEAHRHGWCPLYQERYPHAGGPAHYAGWLTNSAGFKAEVVADTSHRVTRTH